MTADGPDGSDDETHVGDAESGRPETDCAGDCGAGAGGHDHEGGEHSTECHPDSDSKSRERAPAMAGSAVSFSVPEMDCSSCASKVESALGDRDGVLATDLRPTTGTANVTYDEEHISRADLVAAIESAGYETADDGEREAGEESAGTGAVWRSARATKTWIRYGRCGDRYGARNGGHRAHG